MVTRGVHEVIDRALRGIKPAGPRLTQDELAERLGCSQAAIFNYRAGRSVPPNTKVARFAKALGYDYGELLAIVRRDRSIPEKALVARAVAYQAEQLARTA